MTTKNKRRQPAARQKRDGHRMNSRRGATKHRPRRKGGGDRRQGTPAHRQRDPRWDELEAALRAMFPGREDPDIWKKLRSRFDRGVLGPELVRSLRLLRPGDPFGPRMPRDLSDLAERAEELRDCSLSCLAERLEGLLVMRDRIEHDAARALAGLAAALRWAEDQPDAVRALMREIDDEPALGSTAAWPRLAFLLWVRGPEALHRFPEETARLAGAARIELAGRPSLAPAWLYPMLGMGTGDDVPRGPDEHDATVVRDTLQMVADQFGELMFAPGPAMPAGRHAGRDGASANAGTNGEAAAE